jgi:hypothetical protein
LTKKLAYAANRPELDLPSRFADPSARTNVELERCHQFLAGGW